MEKLAGLLADASGLDQVFLCNSGAEANEGAIKLARRWGARHRDGAYEIITMHGSFHGRTLATMAASGKPGWDDIFPPKVHGFRKVPLGDLGAAVAAISSRTVAVMLEPIQGEAGVFPAGDEYLRALSTLTKEHGILLILDEIQTGIGRTGRFFGYQHGGVARRGPPCQRAAPRRAPVHAGAHGIPRRDRRDADDPRGESRRAGVTESKDERVSDSPARGARAFAGRPRRRYVH